MRFAYVIAICAAGCASTETVARDSGAAGEDVAADTARDAAPDTAHCCPLDDRACCMSFGGSRASNPTCGKACDSIPTDLEVRIDDAGCPYWYDPPGGSTTCNPGGPPDAGDTGACCPISDTPACCMNFGGSRAANPSCGMVCDNIPADLERRVDDAGCPYWYDPPGGATTCNVGPPPPDAGDGG